MHIKKNETKLRYWDIDKLSNALLKTSLISVTISICTQPLQALLNIKQQSLIFTPSANFFHWAYRGFTSYAISGQKRGAIAITAKQTHQDLEREYYLHQWLFTLGFSQADIILTNGFKTKSKLENAGIIDARNFKWSMSNFYKLSFNNWGARSISGMVNYAALGIIGQTCVDSIAIDNSTTKQMLGGVCAGMLASLITAVPDFYADQKTLASKMQDFRLVTVSSQSMFSKLHHRIEQQGVKEVLINFIKNYYLKEIAVRCPLTGLTFALIFAGNELLGAEPLQKLTR